jgi:hypothetical protein
LNLQHRLIQEPNCRNGLTKVVPVQLFNDAAIPYLERIEACVAWDVLNSFTSAMKKLEPSVQFESNLKLGKFFTSQQVALPSPHDMMAAL